MKILVMNAGSSSQKSCLYELPGGVLPSQPLDPLWSAQINWVEGKDTAELKVKANGATLKQELASAARADHTFKMLETLWSGDTQVVESPQAIALVGHRVVHGGSNYRQSVLITSAVKAEIDRLSDFAPVHNPVNLAGIEITEKILGSKIPQVAVFDTAFHAQLPPAVYVYPGRYEWLDKGIRRYGFHGISHQYCTYRAAQLLGRAVKDLRLLNCHLGNGASLAAIRNGHSIDTTMGFTPLEGLMMGSRSGSLDPGIIIRLLRQEGYTIDQVDTLLNQDSGLEGLSGISNDMREIDAAIAQGNERAKLALDVYIHRLRWHMGAMLASLEGADAFIFTAGVGENDAKVRAAACAGFEWLGVKLDPAKNEARPVDQDIATPDSSVRVLVIHTQEDWAIAQDCWRIYTNNSTTSADVASQVAVV
jgi:acetate kinase